LIQRLRAGVLSARTAWIAVIGRIIIFGGGGALGDVFSDGVISYLSRKLGEYCGGRICLANDRGGDGDGDGGGGEEVLRGLSDRCARGVEGRQSAPGPGGRR
jgi:hypothetical protein